MSIETGAGSESAAKRKSFGELLGELARHSAALFRDEVDLAVREIREKVKILRGGLIAIVIGAVIGQVALLALCAAAVIKLGALIGFAMSALVIGVGLAAVGGIIVFSGLSRMGQVDLKPGKTIQTLKENKEWLKELTKEAP